MAVSKVSLTAEEESDLLSSLGVLSVCPSSSTEARDSGNIEAGTFDSASSFDSAARKAPRRHSSVCSSPVRLGSATWKSSVVILTTLPIASEEAAWMSGSGSFTSSSELILF